MYPTNLLSNYPAVTLFTQQHKEAFLHRSKANSFFQSVSGISDFFPEEADFDTWKYWERHLSRAETVAEDRAAYGDFQTNNALAGRIVQRIVASGFQPELLIEPTFGQGSFILAALQHFQNLRHIVGFEIYKPYVWETKLSILDYAIRNPNGNKPEIRLEHTDFFQVDLQQVKKSMPNASLLIIGNPPWVTNAALGSKEVANLPKKSNFKGSNGLDAITGKGNFDIAEFIAYKLIHTFQDFNGQMAFLVKNSVIKNIVHGQYKKGARIGHLTQSGIDAQKEFGAAVEASLFQCKLNCEPESSCSVVKPDGMPHKFGWRDGQFVSNLEKYAAVNRYDGICPFEWRQGLKHDCAHVMEFEQLNGSFITNEQTTIKLEKDLVYGLLKSGALKGGVVDVANKYTIVTQKKIGQDTAYIKDAYPLVYAYLSAHLDAFLKRKSSIYKGKPTFSIFGIGDYSFHLYKIGVSGLYKSPRFTLILPDKGKPIMLDDTCYFIGTDNFSEALAIFALLNSNITCNLLQAIAFKDAKRPYSKDVLMRIDLAAIAADTTLAQINETLKSNALNVKLTSEDYSIFKRKLAPSGQISIF